MSSARVPPGMAEPRADYAVEWAQVGLIRAVAVGGAATSVVTAFVVERWWFYALVSLAGLMVGLAAALLVLGRQRRSWDRIEACTDLPPLRSRDAVVRLGAWRGAATVAAVFAVLGLESLVLRDADVLRPVGMLLLVVAGAFALKLRALRRWQRERGLVTCVRVGAARVSWTAAQARAQLVVVPHPADGG